MADDPIAQLADILFAANQVGNIASFHRDKLEAILRSTHAGGRREMAEECAHAVVSAAGAEAQVDLGGIAIQFHRWAAAAAAEERLVGW